MNRNEMDIVILGLSITSSWGNGHATTWRGLVRELERRGHRVLFLERDKPWYDANRDLPQPPYGSTRLYQSLEELKSEYADDVRRADLVIVGSYVPEGIEVGRWVAETAKGKTAFYDIDTPVTLAALENGTCDYLSSDLIPKYNIYLSFTGGPMLRLLERKHGSPRARALYCSVDPELYYPMDEVERTWDLGYLGTYSADRQLALERLLLEPARSWPEGRFVVAGPQYPAELHWPENVERVDHLPPAQHVRFYNQQRCTINLTRAGMVRAGWSPSVRLFEAAACGTAIVSDPWPGLGDIFEIGSELLVSHSNEDTLRILRHHPEDELRQMGEKARTRVLAEHTATHRAEELEQHVTALFERPRASTARAPAFNFVYL